MKTVKLEVAARDKSGSSASKKLRNEGKIPAVIYNNDCHYNVALERKEFIAAAQRSRTSQLFTFSSPANDLDGTRGIVKEIQRDYINGSVLHVDFQMVKDKEAVRLDVPLKVSGEAVGVKSEGGVLTTSCHKIEVKCLPDSIPELIPVDISSLKIGQRIRTGDLELPEGVLLVGNPLEVVAAVVSGRQSRLMAQAAGEGGEEGEAEAQEAGDAA